MTFTATDDGDNTGTPATTTRTIGINVGNVNRQPQIPPLENKTVDRGSVLEFAVPTTDPDGNPLALTVTGLPRFGTFTDQGNGTGLFRFAPDFGDRGTYAINLRATDNGDGGGSTQVLFEQRSFVLTAQSSNEPPQLAYIGDKVAVADSPLQFTLLATDLDQGPLNFSATGLPPVRNDHPQPRLWPGHGEMESRQPKTSAPTPSP